MRKNYLFIPLAGIALMMLVLYIGLNRPRTGLPSPHIGKAIPPFALQTLAGSSFADTDLPQGEVFLLNFFASWCVPCLAEHPLLKHLSEQQQIPIYGFVWNDTPENISAWLAQHGNVYQQVIFDEQQYFGLDLGVYGIPETFLIDREGIVRYRFTGALTQEWLDETILPEMKKWR